MLKEEQLHFYQISRPVKLAWSPTQKESESQAGAVGGSKSFLLRWSGILLQHANRFGQAILELSVPRLFLPRIPQAPPLKLVDLGESNKSSFCWLQGAEQASASGTLRARLKQGPRGVLGLARDIGGGGSRYDGVWGIAAWEGCWDSQRGKPEDRNKGAGTG